MCKTFETPSLSYTCLTRWIFLLSAVDSNQSLRQHKIGRELKPEERMMIISRSRESLIRGKDDDQIKRELCRQLLQLFSCPPAATNWEPSLLQKLDNAAPPFCDSSSPSCILFWLEHRTGWLARNLISLQLLWTGSASMAMLFLQAWLFRFDAWRTPCPPATNFLFLICQSQIEKIVWMWANPAGTKLFKESAFTGSGQTGLPACTLELEFLAGWQRPPSPSASSSLSGSASSYPPPRPSKGSGPSLSRLRSRLQPLPRQKRLRPLQRLARRQELIPRPSSQLWGWICLLHMETSVLLPRPRHTRATWEFLHLLPHLIGALPLPPRRRRLVSLHPS